MKKCTFTRIIYFYDSGLVAKQTISAEVVLQLIVVSFQDDHFDDDDDGEDVVTPSPPPRHNKQPYSYHPCKYDRYRKLLTKKNR